MKKIVSIIAIIFAISLCLQGQKYTHFTPNEQFILSDSISKLAYDYSSNKILYACTNGVGIWQQNTLTNTADEFSVFNDITCEVTDIYIAQSTNTQYFATKTGVKIFQNGSEIPNSISASIKHIAVTADTTIWFSTPANTVAKYKNGITTIIPDNYGFTSGVMEIFSDRNNNVWVLCNGKVVEFCDNGKVKVFSQEFAGLFVYCIFQRSNGDIIIGTNEGIKLYNYVSWSDLSGIDNAAIALTENYLEDIIYSNHSGIYSYNGTTSRLLNKNIVANTMLVSPYDGKICCNNYNSGLVCLDYNGKAETFNQNKQLISQEINILTSDNSGNIFIAGDKGINIIDDFSWYSQKLNLRNNSVNAVCYDNDVLWIGTNNSLLKKNNASTSQVLDTEIIAIVSDENNNIYAASETAVYTINNGTITDTFAIPNTYQPAKDLVYNNGLWLASENGAIMKIFAQAPEQATEFQDFVQFLSINDTIYIICENSINYFATNDEVSDLATASVTNIDGVANYTIKSATVNDDYVYLLCCDADNAKLYKYDHSLRNCVEIQDFYSNNLDFPHRYIKIASTGNNIIWALTDNNSVEKINFLALSNDNLRNSISATNSSCVSSNDASITVNVASVNLTSFSIDGGTTWQNGNTFTNQTPGYKHIIANFSENQKCLIDTVIFIPYVNHNNAAFSYVQPECAGEKGKVEIANFGSGIYMWETANATSPTRENLSAGNYSVTIEENGCTKSFYVAITEQQNIEVEAETTDLLCFGNENGGINLIVSGGNAPYSYLWSNGGTTNSIGNLAAGNYTCSVSDKNFCETTFATTITQPNELIIGNTIQHISCYGVADGKIEISISGGTPNYTILWADTENNTLLREGLTANIYHVTIVDENNCSNSASFNILQAERLVANTINIIQNRCYGDTIAEITTNVVGGTGNYTFAWQRNGVAFSNTQNLQNLQAGNYSLTVTDENLCTTTAEAIIEETPELVAMPLLTPVTCYNYNDGRIVGSAIGGSGVYAQYFWFNENNTTAPICVTNEFNNVAPGNYILVVKDSRNCTDSTSITVDEPIGFNFTTSVTNASCNGNNNGSIIITTQQPLSEYNFAWQDEVSTSNIATGLVAGEYTITITDTHTNCQQEITEIVEEPEMHELDILGETPLCFGSETTLEVGNFASYEWNNGSTNASLIVDTEGEYSVTVTDNTNCKHFAVANVFFRSTSTDNLRIATITDENKVKLLWKKSPNQGIEFYTIYRANDHDFVEAGQVNYNAIAVFEDTVDASLQSYTYKISTTNDCGYIGMSEQQHSTINLQTECANGLCYLTWTGYEGATTDFYYILSGNSPDNLQITDSTMFANTDFSEAIPSEAGTYYRIMMKLNESYNVGNGELCNTIYSNIAFCYNGEITDINETAIINIDAYPNPFNSEIFVEIDADEGEICSYEIINSLGQIVERDIFKCRKISIGSKLDTGSYLLNIRIGNERRIIKINKLN